MTAQHPHNALGGSYFYYFAEEKAEAQRDKVICSRSHGWWPQSQLGSLRSGWSLSPLGGGVWVWALGLLGLLGWQDLGGLFCLVLFPFSFFFNCDHSEF